MIVPYAPGGPVDIVGRTFAPKLGEALGQPVVVENRPGGGTLVGTRAALQAPPDGYTIMLHTPTLVLNSLAYKAPGYKMSDFVALHPVTSSQLILSIHQSVPVTNLAELIAYARARPGKLTSGSLGASSVTHLSFERFRAAAGMETLSVTYSGSGPTSQALIGGVLDMFLDSASSAIQTFGSGKTRMLAVSGSQRHRLAPDVPTFVELGYPTMASAMSAISVFASAKTPETIVLRLRGALGKAITAANVQERLTLLGYDRPVAAQDFPAFIRQDALLWEQDVRRAKLALDE